MKRRVKSKKARRAGKSYTGSSVVRVTRVIKPLTRLTLFVRAGGRCEFDGCNSFLLEHHLTLTEGNFAQVAHIVAFSKDGPRGDSTHQPKNVNDIVNLMLLCPACHKLIDDNPEKYPVPVLEEHKSRHEERIHHLTGLGPDLKTMIVQFKTRIAGQTVTIPITQVMKAITPRYPLDAKGHVIDLTAFENDGTDFITTARQEIEQRIARLYEQGLDLTETRHISLFALAPIPLLVFLGSCLSNKVEVDLYQRHRDTEDWTWKTDGEPVAYQFLKVRDSTDTSKVALLLSLSGKIAMQSLPLAIDEHFTVYELTLARGEPAPTFLRMREDLANFKQTYQTALRAISRAHAQAEAIHFFPAIPAPIAVLCGRERLPKIDPKFLIYDNDKRRGSGFVLNLEVS